MKAVLINYQFTPNWLKDYDFDYWLFDRSDSKDYLKDFPQERITYTRNIGNVDYDKLTFLIDNYDSLPEQFLWGKSNLFKYISKPEFDAVLASVGSGFAPLLTQEHKTYNDRNGIVCYYANGMYNERNDSWYLNEVGSRYVNSWADWAREFQLPVRMYIPFPPGGNFILTKERVHRYSVDLYIKMRSMLDYAQLPGEAHCAERSYFLLWS